MSMSFRRLPQLLLLRSDAKGKIEKSIVRGRKRKKEPEGTQKKKKKTKAKKIIVLRRHNVVRNCIRCFLAMQLL